MTSAAAAERDRLGAWCGWVLTAAAALTPLIAWLGPLGFALLMAVTGLLCLPALRVSEEDRPLAVVLAGALVWAAISTSWSPFQPRSPEGNTALKLALQLPLYWAAWCGARRADAGGVRRTSIVLAWGLAALGAMMLVEAATDATVYRAIREAIGDPIRPDLARKNLAHATFVLALLWPVAAAGGARAGAPRWLGLPMAAGATFLAWRFLSDAPVLGLPVGLAAGVAVWRWPQGAPRALALAAAAYVLAMPVVMLVPAVSGAESYAPLSWAERLGYWGHARDWILDRPLRGWGLDASRMFAPGIQLHPHDGALQAWLELGAAGAGLMALFWAIALRRLSRPAPSLPAAATAASASIYLLFGAINFGLWQEWWLALGAYVAMLGALAEAARPRAATVSPPVAKASTSAAPLG